MNQSYILKRNEKNARASGPSIKMHLLANLGGGNPDDVHSLRPFKYTGTRARIERKFEAVLL